MKNCRHPLWDNGSFYVRYKLVYEQPKLIETTPLIIIFATLGYNIIVNHIAQAIKREIIDIYYHAYLISLYLIFLYPDNRIDEVNLFETHQGSQLFESIRLYWG